MIDGGRGNDRNDRISIFERSVKPLQEHGGDRLCGEKAVADLTRAIGLDSKTSWFFRWRGEALSELSRRAEARADFDAALSLNPNDARAQELRGALP